MRARHMAVIDSCLIHRRLRLPYLAWHEEAERRAKRGMKQRQCPTCKLWMWSDEYGPGWAAGLKRT